MSCCGVKFLCGINKVLSYLTLSCFIYILSIYCRQLPADRNTTHKNTRPYSSWACCRSFLQRLSCSWSSSWLPLLRDPSLLPFRSKIKTQTHTRCVSECEGEREEEDKEAAPQKYGGEAWKLCNRLSTLRIPKALRIIGNLKAKNKSWLGFLALVSDREKKKFFGRTGPLPDNVKKKKDSYPTLTSLSDRLQGSRASSPTLLRCSLRLPALWKGCINAASARETALIFILHSCYRHAHTEAEEADAARFTDGCAPQRTPQLMLLISDALWRCVLRRFVSFWSHSLQDSLQIILFWDILCVSLSSLEIIKCR